MVDDKTAEEFAAYMKKFMNLYAALTRLVKNNIKILHPCILDLGCGPGLLSVEILKQIPDALVIGIDPLIKMLILAKENIDESGVKNFEPVLGVSEKIPLKDNTIDAIVSRFSLPYWKQPHKSFLEMYRVLKPDGKIIFESLNRNFPKWKLFGIKIGMLFNRAGPDVTKYHVDAYRMAHTQEEVENFFKKTGFVLLEKIGSKSQWKFIIVAQKKISISSI